MPNPHETSARPELRQTGEEGVWILILGDMLLFWVFFMTYMYYRSQDSALYDSSQLALNKGLGLVNTLILLTSSWCVAAAVDTARRNETRLARQLIGGAGALGCSFIVIKIVEYSEKIGEGIAINTNEFFMFYFMLTGIHLLHVLVGTVFLLVMFAMADGNSSSRVAVLESGGLFWHLVDLLWVVLFTMLYLVRT